MSYLQVAVTAGRERATMVSDWLSEQGALSVTVESATDEIMFDEAAPGEPGWEDQRLTALFPAEIEPTELLAGLNQVVENSSARLQPLADQDWERSWLDQFQSIKVTDRFWICPSWCEPPDSEATNLQLDPGLAFGTGTHPTTLLCLRELLAMNLTNCTVVDYGCGSGVLAIAALMSGAARAFATDVDPRALEATRENAGKNGVEDRLVCVAPDQLQSAIIDSPVTDVDAVNATQGADTGGMVAVDVVVANILAGTLIRLSDELVSLCRPDTTLILSGVLSHQIEQVAAAFDSTTAFATRQEAEWALLRSSPREDLVAI